MQANEAQNDRTQAFLGARFRDMGLATREMPDGRSWLVSLPIEPHAFTGLDAPWSAAKVVFSTLDSGRIKCLRPAALFGLPPIDVRDASRPEEIETAIRRAWDVRTNALRAAQNWLASRGEEGRPQEGGGHVAFPLAGEADETLVRMIDAQKAILPGAGPLSGCAAESLEERLVPLDRQIETSSDLELHLSARIDALTRAASKRDQAHRKRRLLERDDRKAEAPTALAVPRPEIARPRRHLPRVLLVGQRLLEQAPLRELLTRAGFRVATARSESEALMRLAQTTPDAVVSEYGLGRSDGASLIQATRAVAGIEGVPVVLVDQAAHPARRDIARAVGAKGYVVGPTDPKRFVARLRKLVEEPGGRRFTRYAGRFDARLQDVPAPCLATEVGRGGIFIATDLAIELHRALSGQLLLPEIGRPLTFEGEVLYRAESQGALPGFGLGFRSLSDEDESALIAFLAQRDAHR